MTQNPTVLDYQGNRITDVNFSARDALYNSQNIQSHINIKEIPRDENKILVVSHNIFGVGHRSHKILKLLQAIKNQMGKYPELVLLQEARGTVFQSHVPGYHVIQKFRCECEEEMISTRIQQPGSGNVILIKDGYCFNLLEWACFEVYRSNCIIYHLCFEE